MLGRRDDHQFVAVNQNHRQPGVGDRHRHETKVHRIVDHRFQDLAVIGARDVHRHVRILLLELGKDFGKDVQAGAFIGADDDLAPGHALGLGDRDQHRLAGFKNLFSIFLEELAGSGDGNLAAGAVEQLGPDLFLQGADLRRDGRLRAKALLGSTREGAVARDLKKRFQLFKIHKSTQPSALSVQLSIPEMQAFPSEGQRQRC